MVLQKNKYYNAKKLSIKNSIISILKESECMKPSILLVNPYIHDFTAHDLWMKPLGIYWLASYLQQKGYDISLIDCVDRYQPLWLQSQGIKKPKSKSNGTGPIPFEIIEKPKLYAPILRRYRRYGIPIEIFKTLLSQIPSPCAILVTSMMTYWYPGVFETIQILKEVFPKTPVALGGVYATLCSEHARKYSQADRVFEGPGEIQALKWLSEITGIEQKMPDKGAVPIEELPMPMHQLLFPGSIGVVATSLGCPLHCTYCASKQLQPHFRQRPLDKVLQEILYLVHKKHVKNIAFYDDALLVNAEKHILPLLEQIGEHSLQTRFHTPNGIHSRLMTPALAKAFDKAHVETIRFSYERSPVFSPYDTPKIEDKDIAMALECFRQADPDKKRKIEVYVKVGLPGQTMEEVIEGFLYVHKVGGYIKFTDYSPVPGTPDFSKTMQKYGLDEKEPLYQNNTTLPYFMGQDEKEEVHPFKALVNVLNYALEQEINLFQNPALSSLFWNAANKLKK